MQTFFYYFKKILFAKWCFRLPLKKKILLYDGEGDHIMSLFFKREDYEILDIRFERINISLISYWITLIFNTINVITKQIWGPNII